MRSIQFLRFVREYGLIVALLNFIIGLPRYPVLPFYGYAYLVAVSFGLYCLFKKKPGIGWKALLVLFLVPLFFFPISTAWIPYLACAGYGGYLLVTGQDRGEYRPVEKVLKAGAFLFAVILVPATIANRLTIIGETVIPYEVLFFIGSISSMRILRHSEENQANPQLLKDNLRDTLILLALAVLLGLKVVRQGIWKVIVWIYTFLLTWIIRGLYLIFGWLINAINRLMEHLREILGPSFDSVLNRLDFSKLQTDDLVDGSQEFAQQASNYLFVRVAMAILIGLLVFFVLYKILHRRLSRVQKTAEFTEEREIISAQERKKKKEKKLRRRGTPIERIRLFYQDYLDGLRTKEVKIRKNDTTREIEQKAVQKVPEQEHDRIRDIYVSARYGGQAQEQDAETLKKLI